MKTIDPLMTLLTQVFLPVALLLGGLGVVLVDQPAGFTASVTTLIAFAVCLLVAPGLRRPGRARGRTRALAR